MTPGKGMTDADIVRALKAQGIGFYTIAPVRIAGADAVRCHCGGNLILAVSDHDDGEGIYGVCERCGAKWGMAIETLCRFGDSCGCAGTKPGDLLRAETARKGK